MPLSVDEDGKASPCHTKSSVVYFCMVFYVLFFCFFLNNESFAYFSSQCLFWAWYGSL